MPIRPWGLNVFRSFEQKARNGGVLSYDFGIWRKTTSITEIPFAASRLRIDWIDSLICAVCAGKMPSWEPERRICCCLNLSCQESLGLQGQASNKYIRFVSVKAERPNHPSRGRG